MGEQEIAMNGVFMRCSLLSFFLSIACGLEAQAQPSVQILEPQEGSCVNNGAETFVIGGMARPPLRPLPLILELQSPEGGSVDLIFQIDGEEISRARYSLSGPDPEIVEDYSLANIEDGPNRNLEVIVSQGPQDRGSDSVNFRLDRQIPEIELDSLEVACLDEMPQAEYIVTDTMDDNPLVVEEEIRDGCLLQRVIRAQDHCGEGNASEVHLSNTRPVQRDEIQLSFSGYACNASGCPIEGPEAMPFGEGDIVSRAVVYYNIEVPNSCLGRVSSIVTMGNQSRFYMQGGQLEEPGEYQIDVELFSCDGNNPIESGSFSFSLIPGAIADAGGPYEVAQGEPLILDASNSSSPPQFGEISQYYWDLNNDSFFDIVGPDAVTVEFNTLQPVTEEGEDPYLVRLMVETEGGEQAITFIEVRLLSSPPSCELGGPYAVREGELLQLFGSATPGNEADPIISYSWDFGDGTRPQISAELSEPLHIYTEGGEYSVVMRVDTLASNCSAETLVQVEDVIPVVQGLLVYNMNNLQEGEQLRFSAGETAPGSPSDPIIDYHWEFGDGNEQSGATLREPEHRYEDQGEYQVCLTVNDEDSPSEPGCLNILVADLEPIVEFEGPDRVVEGEEVTFRVSLDQPGGAADALTAFEWDFGDGEPIRREIRDKTQTHRFSGVGASSVQIVRLTLHDEDSSVSVEREITVIDVVPIAQLFVNYGDDQIAEEGESILLDASESLPGAESDPLIRYRWDFGNGELQETEEPLIEYAWPDDGSYELRMTVFDLDGSPSTSSMIVEIINRDPTVSLLIEEPFGELGESLHFEALVEDSPGDLPAEIYWDFGDGNSADGAEVDHIFTEVGVFEVVVTVLDGDGGRAEDQLFIDISEAPPIISGDEVVHGQEGELINFTVLVESGLRSGEGEEPAYDGPTYIIVDAPAYIHYEILPVEEQDPTHLQQVLFSWVPTVFDSGEYEIEVIARGPLSGASRRHHVQLLIEDVGAPLMAAAALDQRGRTQLRIYQYEREEDVRLSLLESFELGMGLGEIISDPEGSALFVALPESAEVAVLQFKGGPHLVRKIPVERGIRRLLWADGLLWGLASDLFTIDPETLKVQARYDLQEIRVGGEQESIPRPTDMVWIPSGALGNELGTMLITGADGELLLLPPEREDQLKFARTNRHHFNHLALSLERNQLFFTDYTEGELLVTSAANLLADPNRSSFGEHEITFPARDLQFLQGAAWAILPQGLVRFERQAEVFRNISSRAISVLPETIFRGGGVVIAEGRRVRSYDAQLEALVSVETGPMDKIYAFIARLE